MFSAGTPRPYLCCDEYPEIFLRQHSQQLGIAKWLNYTVLHVLKKRFILQIFYTKNLLFVSYCDRKYGRIVAPVLLRTEFYYYFLLTQPGEELNYEVAWIRIISWGFLFATWPNRRYSNVDKIKTYVQYFSVAKKGLWHFGFVRNKASLSIFSQAGLQHCWFLGIQVCSTADL